MLINHGNYVVYRRTANPTRIAFLLVFLDSLFNFESIWVGGRVRRRFFWMWLLFEIDGFLCFPSGCTVHNGGYLTGGLLLWFRAHGCQLFGEFPECYWLVEYAW